MDASFPRLSPSGLHVVSGFGTIYIDGQAIAAGQHGSWLSEDEIAFCDPQGVPRAYHRQSHTIRLLGSIGFNSLMAGGDQWIGWRADASQVHRSNGPIITAAFNPAISEAGLGCYLTSPTTEQHELRLTDGRLIETGPLENPRISRQAVAWSRYTGGVARRTYARLLLASTPVDCHASYQPYEFVPIPFDVGALGVSDDVWLLSNDDTRLLLRPAGSTFGYVVHDGPIHDSGGKDAHWVPSVGQIRVVWGNTNGTLGERWIALGETRVDLSQPPPAVEPVPMPTGTVIEDTSRYTVCAPEWVPRLSENDVQMDWYTYDASKGRYAEVKYGNHVPPGEHSKFFVAFRWDPDFGLRLHEDWSRGDQPVRPYSFSDDRWIPKRWAVGDVLTCQPNTITESDEHGNDVTTSDYAYQMTFAYGYHQVDCHGDVGVASVIVTEYNPSFWRQPGQHDLLEYTWHASKDGRAVGRVRYLEINRLSGEVVKDVWSVRLDRSGHRAVPMDPIKPWEPDHPEPEPEPPVAGNYYAPNEDLDMAQLNWLSHINTTYFGEQLGCISYGSLSAWHHAFRGWIKFWHDGINRYANGVPPGDPALLQKIAQWACRQTGLQMQAAFPGRIPDTEIPADPFQ